METVTNIRQVINDVVEKVKSPTSLSLGNLIRHIRAVRTAAEEREIVNKECALIRDTFREEDSVSRCDSVAKLLYIHILGYPAHFGQLECLKLVASPLFAHKRMGYLGCMLLLDERQDVHLLLTNSLKNDLNSNVQFVVGLALCTLGAIASPEMARDLAGEVEALLKSNNAYIRKKAALCAYRIVAKVPDLFEMFLPCCRQLIAEKNHGVMIGGVTLISKICEINSDSLIYFRKLIPHFARLLKVLLRTGYSLDRDVCGICDPFLQVKVLRLLRLLGRNDDEASDAMGDILTQVITSTDSTKSAGSAILYEVFLSIMETNSQTALKVLAVNTLCRFLLSSEKNIRYVSLCALLRLVHVDIDAVQRHRDTVLECLKSTDSTIRRRAMELCFALLNGNNIRVIMHEMLVYIESAEPTLQAECSSKCVLAAERFSPSVSWHVDTLIRVLRAAGNNVRDDVTASTIQLVAAVVQQHSHVLLDMWRALAAADHTRQPLLQVCVWGVGEYGDLLMTAASSSKAAAGAALSDSGPVMLNEDIVTKRYEEILSDNLISLVTREYVVMSLMKLSTRFNSQSAIDKIRLLVGHYACHLNLELQQRAVEFSQLFQPAHDHLRPALLERMPPPVAKAGGQVGGASSATATATAATQEPATNGVAQPSSALLDLIGDLDGGSSVVGGSGSGSGAPLHNLTSLHSLAAPTTTTNNNNNNIGGGSSNSSALLDLLGGVEVANGVTAAVATAKTESTVLHQQQQQQQQQPPLASYNTGLIHGLEGNTAEVEAYNRPPLRVTMVLRRDAVVLHQCSVTATFTNTSLDQHVTEFLFQAAVPKSIQLQLMPASGSVLLPGTSVTQLMTINNPSKAVLRMRVRLSFVCGGQQVTDQTEVSSFPPSCYQ